jgi:HPt (histidine-containing phosphotransfer) domain-containing protein
MGTLRNIDDTPRLADRQLEQLEMLDGGTGELYGELFEMWTATVDEGMTILESAVNSGNFQEMLSYSHKLKGSCSNIGAGKLSAIFENMEVLSDGNEVAPIADLFKLAVEEYPTAKQSLHIHFGLSKAA